MNYSRSAIALCISIFALSAHAGIPSEELIPCPIGGEKITVVNTLSCTSGFGHTMSFRGMSSCDFITHLPQCPSNKLPLYREFDRNQLTKIETFMKTAPYQDAAKISRFYLAHMIQAHLNDDQDFSPFTMLLQGYWYDPEHSIGNEEYYKAFKASISNEIAKTDPKQHAYIYAISAYIAAKSNDSEDAKQALLKARSNDAAIKENATLATYIENIEICITNPDASTCDPEFVIETTATEGN